MTAIEFENISKQYRLGLVSTRTLSHDLNRWWQTSVLRREDPYLKIGDTNDRATRGDSEYVWALRAINFKVEQGDVVGIIGKNGAGKSTLLKLLSKVTTPTTGTIRARGRIASLLEVGTGFHGEMTGRENIYLNGAIMGMTKQEIDRKLYEIVDFSGCERYIDTPVKRYSSGMTVRLGFAVAAHLDPEILVVDEVLAVGDAEFQKKAIGKMQDISHGEGRTVLFVSHNMASIQTLCNNGILLNNGQIQMIGKIDDVISEYLINKTTTQSELYNRIDRKGNQALKVVDCYMLRDGKKLDTIRVGDKFNIYVKLRQLSQIYRKNKIELAINICNVLEQKVLQLSNTFLGIPINIVSEITTVHFSIDKMPLSPGQYYLRFYLYDGIEILDWIDHAYSFIVEEGDYYKNGIVENSAMYISEFNIKIT